MNLKFCCASKLKNYLFSGKIIHELFIKGNKSVTLYRALKFLIQILCFLSKYLINTNCDFKNAEEIFFCNLRTSSSLVAQK